MESQLVDLGDGRVLEVVDLGPTGAPTIVFHSGTPSGLVLLDPLVDAVVARGMRLVTSVRPGYGRSTPQPGRVVADVAADIAVVARELDIDAYVAMGHSGGGPHALACRALDAPRCRGAVIIAGAAPCGVEGLDFLAGMGDDNVEEYGAALEGEATLREWLEGALPAMAAVTAADLIDTMGSLLPEVDRTHLREGMAEFLAAAVRAGVASGIAGWRDDDLAFVRPWGFELAGLTAVSLWQGSDDLMVPFAHGQWLARTIVAATAHLLEGEGHISVLAGRLDEMLDEAATFLAG